MHTNKSDNHIITQDPATYIGEKPPIIPKKSIPVAILAVLGLILISVGAVWYLNGQSFNFNKEVEEQFVVEPIDETVIATVGSEKIYGEDLKYKKSQVAPQMLSAELEAELFERLIDESIILQAGAEADYINLSEAVFNTPLKDQQQRQKLITQVTDMVNQRTSYKKGAFVSIWFMNEDPGPIGYEEGKRVALEKISALHAAVENGSMTIKQAGEAIRNDSSLAQLDSSYKSNAYSEFDTSLKDKISFSDEFNQEFVNLSNNQVTDVIAIQDHPAGDPEQPKIDALYAFGQVTEVKTEGPPSFSTWLEGARNNYEIIKD